MSRRVRSHPALPAVRRTRLDRRAFLCALAALLAPWRELLLPRLEPPCAAEAEARRVAARIAQLVADPRAAQAVGDAYLARAPAESESAALARGICFALPGPPAARSGALRRQLARAVRRDFERGDTLQLHGWLVSRTEARVCALASLARSGASLG